MKRAIIGLVALAASVAITANAAPGDDAKPSLIEYCQGIIDQAKEMARAKKAGHSVNDVLRMVNQSKAEASIQFAVRERAVRVFSADDSDDEVSRIGAECMIAHGLIKVK